ncbi:helix-turn-helix transcriptional regulator [Fictibacillus sp. Mic-4]|uniref:helix-turn-helix domain-containing protein n=1 Tax=Fictibacillus sp. Mic-4 TaxID=3132826 RepID=UPI003CFACBCE
MDLKQFGLYFAELREKSGYESQRQLSIVSGVSNGTIARIEDGTQKPKPSTLKKLSKHLKNVTYKELMEAAGYIESNSDPEEEYDFRKDESISREAKELIEQLLSLPYEKQKELADMALTIAEGIKAKEKKK